jgi:pimeloyl-ACP methyl ester carboxylesterase
LLPLLFYREYGAGPPLVVLHGLFGSGTNWRGIARQLAATHRVLLPDQRNHGRSPHTDTMSYPEMVWDLWRWLDDLGISRVALLGHSMGGKVAMAAALTERSRVASLIVVDIAPKKYAENHAVLGRALHHVDPEQIRRRSDADTLLQTLIPDDGLRGFLLQNLASRGERFYWRLNLEAIEASMPSLLDFPADLKACYPGPVLFVRGARSDYLHCADADLIYRYFPAARIETIEGAGHWVHADQPQPFLELVERFLGTPRR